LSSLFKAYRETAAIDAEREEKKRKERVLKRWERLITGLKIRRRMQKEYGVSQVSLRHLPMSELLRVVY
jgi:xeroderma pigmentosum group C-complementing protein